LLIAGRPLLKYSLLQARQAPWVKEVHVCTEDAELDALARAHGAEVVWRPDEPANDTATSESALLDGRVPELLDPGKAA
jgi:N-acylneuraminate cytidylyltransferase